MINQQYKLRCAAVFLFFCTCYGIILLNLYVTQIRNAHFFSGLATQQYHINITKLPPRAPIFDRTKKRLLALNKDCISAFIVPHALKSPETLKPFLQKNFPYALKQLKKHPQAQFMYVKRRLNEEQQKLIEQSNIKDIQLLRESSRYYPVAAAAQIVGITDIDNKGILGMELQCNTQLTGTPSTYCLQKDARTGYYYFEKETKVTGIQGEPIALTIDSDLQFLAHDELNKTMKTFNASEGAVIIMNPDNGEILAMTSMPTFNPNDTTNLPLDATKNRVLTESYEFGSVIKVFAALAALQEQVVTLEEEINCRNTKSCYIDGRKINTTIAHGIISFADVIAFSNNIGIAIVAKRIQEKLYDHYIQLGFGQKTNINFPGEQTGFVNPPERWSKQSIISLSYGYEITGTLLQLARAMSIIANGGYAIKPKLLLSEKIIKDDNPLYPPETLALIEEILTRTTNYGTTRRAKIKGYTIMCKTGTANLLENGYYNPTKNIYTCSGIIKKENYKRVIITFIKEAQGKRLFAATVAVPLFEKIAEKTLIHERVL